MMYLLNRIKIDNTNKLIKTLSNTTNKNKTVTFSLLLKKVGKNLSRPFLSLQIFHEIQIVKFSKNSS